MENNQIIITELDAAVQAHLEWTRRVLRCAVLRVSPGGDVLNPEAHRECRFGKWMAQNRPLFDSLDANKAVALGHAHKAMHDAIRNLCEKILCGKPGEESDLGAFETSQTLLVSHLAEFKTLLVQSESQIDPLTGLPLRHRIEDNFEQIRHRAHRSRAMPAAMLVDLDKFKEINDRHGHVAGDMVLREFAACLRQAVREEDQVYRYGVEEFVILSEQGSREGAVHAGERILDAIRQLEVSLPGGRAVVRPTATVGIALLEEGESFKHLIHRADLALYAGKDAGRDRFVLAYARIPS